MGPASVDWLPAVGVLVAGLTLGLVFVWRVNVSSRRGAQAPAVVPLEVRDLEGKRDVLYQQLRELDDTAFKRQPDQLARERYELELAAARVLQQLDEHAEVLTRKERKESARRRRDQALPPPVANVASTRPALRGFLWGIGSTAALAGLVFFVTQAARPRDPGRPATGEGPPSSPPSSPSAPDDDSQLRAAVARNPDDLEARLNLAQAQLARQDLMAVWNETQYVLKRAPGNPRALSYQALVRLAMGQSDQAVSMLKQAMSTDPDLLEPYLHLTLVYVRLGRQGDAETLIAEASRRFPAKAAGLKRLLADMRAQSEAEGEAVPEGDPHAGVPIPSPATGAGTRDAGDRAAGTGVAGGRAAPGAGPARPGADRKIAGVVEVDGALKGAIAPGSVVFVTVRDASFGAGPPLAAKRLPATGFPLAFEITGADSMMGETLPDSMLVEARLDPDGDPMTRSPSDPKVRLEDVKAGSTGLRLVLRPAAP